MGEDADRIQAPCSWLDTLVIDFDTPPGPVNSRRDTPAAAYCSAEPDESHKLAFLGMQGAPRVRRISTSSLGRRTNSLRFLQVARPSPDPSDGDENTALRPRAEGDAGAAVTRVSTHHTEAIRGMCNLIYRKAYPLASVAIARMAARAS